LDEPPQLQLEQHAGSLLPRSAVTPREGFSV